MATITGTNAAETILGTPLDDTINSLNGGDKVIGRGGNDKITGGTGNDSLYGDVGPYTVISNHDNGWSGLTLTASTSQAPTVFNSTNVSDTTNGLGVKGETIVGDLPTNNPIRESELGYNPTTNTSEVIRMDFDAPVTSAQITFANL
ncbi:MAG: hypothetical protein K2X98_05130, partial [Alphaproteobacteria bacterium]|nr:hypothetical protein [Alphaproteobacteria bacterium]